MTREYVDREAIEAEAARRWAADAELREEFAGRFEVYRAYAVAHAEGRIKLCGGGVVRGVESARSAPGAAAGSGAGIAATQERSGQHFDAARYRPGGDLYDAATRRAFGS